MVVSRWHRGLALAALFVGLLTVLPPASAREGDSAENRLRAALRQAVTRLRELEDQNATLDAKQVQTERERQALAEKLDAVQKELDALRHRNDADKAELQRSAAKLESTESTLAKWQDAYKQAADVARARDADAKRLDARVESLEADAKRRDAALVRTREMKRACEAKNAELFKLGNQVLDLYDKKGVWDAIAEGEPVTRLKRVEYENILQDYEDKLRDNQIVPPPSP
jgi:chromosome segregation ATPase